MPLPFDPRAGFFEHALLEGLHLMGFRSERVATAAGRIHVLRGKGTGGGPPTVLLHGFSSSGVHFFNLLKHLRPHVRELVVPDLPAHGFSDTPSPLSPDLMEAGLLEALDASIDERALIYGNSMGGLAAVRFALKRPGRVLGLILCSPVGAPMTEAEIRRFRLRFDVSSHGRAVAFIDRVFESAGPMRHLLAWGVRRKFSHPAMKEILGTLSEGHMLSPQDLSSLSLPILFVWGRSERVLPPEHREFFLANLPKGTQVQEPPRFGHGPYLTHPEATAEQILSFARSLSQTAPARPHGASPGDQTPSFAL